MLDSSGIDRLHWVFTPSMPAVKSLDGFDYLMLKRGTPLQAIENDQDQD